MSNKQPVSRVDQAISKWRAQEQRYVQQYGNNIYNDRDFMKVRASAYKMIYDQYNGKKLGFEEKLDLKILRGQIRQMNERIYPNRYMRAAVGIMKLLSRPAIAIGKLGINILSYLVAGQPYFKNKPYRGKEIQQSPNKVQPAQHQQKPVVEQHIQKHIPRQRVLTAQQNGQNIRR